jgi:hypothetical protein
LEIKRVSIISTILLIIVYLIFHKRNNDKKFRVIFLYAVLSYFFDRFINILERLILPSNTSKIYTFSLFTLIEYTIFCYFFYVSYKEKSFKRLVLYCFPVFLLVFIYNLIYNRDIEFDNISSSVSGLFTIIFCILYFYEQLKNPEVSFIYDSKSFWIVIGFLIYKAATLFLFISIGVLTLTHEEILTAWSFNNVGNIIKNVLFAIAFSKPLVMSIDSSAKGPRLKRTGKIFSIKNTNSRN